MLIIHYTEQICFEYMKNYFTYSFTIIMFMVFEKWNDFLQGGSYINAINIILFQQAVSKKRSKSML